ncbi:hypothetical protein ACFL4X_01845 [Gemmatimonadota bacterium]
MVDIQDNEVFDDDELGVDNENQDAEQIDENEDSSAGRTGEYGDQGVESQEEASEEEETDSAAGADWFVDFDVWQASLEAKFGPDFEQVLSSELGANWVNKLSLQMRNASSFQKVLDDIKSRIAAHEQTGYEQVFEIDDSPVEEGQVAFEALGPGEVIYDEKMVGPGGRGGGGGGGRGRALPNLADIRKKEFDSAGEQKVSLDQAINQDEINNGATLPDDEVVLMDRNDFSRLSYFARKELDRHKDDLETKKVLERESKKIVQRPPIGGFNRVILSAASIVLLYAIYSLVSLPVGEYYEDKIMAANPADYLFQPSTSMHKQGELSRAGDPTVPGSGGALSFYFLQTSLNRFELRHVIDGQLKRYDLALYNGKNLEIVDGPWGGSLEVHRFYSQNWPTNRSAVISAPYLSLSHDGEPVLLAFEKSVSGMLPGLLALDIVTKDGDPVGLACVADNLLHIRITDSTLQSGQAEANLTKQLVFLFSLLEL